MVVLGAVPGSVATCTAGESFVAVLALNQLTNQVSTIGVSGPIAAGARLQLGASGATCAKGRKLVAAMR